MPYQVLARKYRPQRFADVIGQEHVTRTLLNALEQDRIAHGYIFSGHRGIGKTTIARILAMALECHTPQGTPERPTPEPCGACEACLEIRAGNAMDVIEIDAATNRGIDEIRELREGARYSPARDRYKIYILDEAHQITDAAFNALLKTLEEPPSHVIFMMATTQPEDIPQTIRSRCQHFSFHAVRFDDIVAQLHGIAEKESIVADPGALALLAEAGDGSMRDALSIMDQAIASAPVQDGKHVLETAQIGSLMGALSNQVFEDMMGTVARHDAAAMLEQAGKLLDAGNNPQQIARQMVRFLRNCLMARLAGEESELLQISDEEKTRASRIAASFSEEDLTRFLNSMLRTFDDLGYRQEQRFHLELGLMKLVHMQRIFPFEELFRQLSGGSETRGELQRKTPSSRATAAEASVTRAAAENATLAPKLIEAASPLSSKPAVTSATTSAATIEKPEGETDPSRRMDLDSMRAAICEALRKNGHETPAGWFETGAWAWDGNELKVDVNASKTLLDMAYTTPVQQMVRESVRQVAGFNGPLRVEPVPVSATGNGKAPPQAPAGDRKTPDGQPENHPLIRYAQELFRAEIRGVVSLRDPN